MCAGRDLVCSETVHVCTGAAAAADTSSAARRSDI